MPCGVDQTKNEGDEAASSKLPPLPKASSKNLLNNGPGPTAVALGLPHPAVAVLGQAEFRAHQSSKRRSSC